MAHLSPFHRLAFQAPASSSRAVGPRPYFDEGAASVDVTYEVLWTAGNPPHSWSPPRRLSMDLEAIAVGIAEGRPPRPPPSVFHGQIPSTGWTEDEGRHLRYPGLLGSVRITGSVAEGSTRSRFPSHNIAPSSSKTLEGKIPCTAILSRGTLGALSACLNDTTTDSFSNFSPSDATWAQQEGYHDYGDVQMSTRKWIQGSWVSVKDDNGHDFLFLMVDKAHGLVRVWRPNLVAKRIVGVGQAELTHEEVLRLGLNDDEEF